MTDLVFVYGTLKRGFHNHSLLSSSSFLGQAETCKSFVVLDGPGFPFMVKKYQEITKLPVVGELYSVNKSVLAQLDHLEGNGLFYERELISVQLECGALYLAWAYLLMDLNLAANAPTSARVDSKYRWQINKG